MIIHHNQNKIGAHPRCAQDDASNFKFCCEMMMQYVSRCRDYFICKVIFSNKLNTVTIFKQNVHNPYYI